jgi:hypothetical protein
MGIEKTTCIPARATRRITKCGKPGQLFWIYVED